MYHAKTAEPIEMPLGGTNSCTKGTMCYMGLRSPMGRGQFVGVVRRTEKHWESLLRCMEQRGSFIQSSITARHAVWSAARIL